ncbi:MAG: Nif3-like dinuclear metal center hexameric protein [Firmicutes bacterium]|nr:Nif3-like dinuclear metal center hexameric protein [Bacillota bacterium]
MKTTEIWNLIGNICPSELAEEWDNSGPQISFDDDEITKVLVALEVTFDVVKEAIKLGANLIVTHHPLYFGGNAYITPEYTIGKYTLELVKNRISVFSAHTSFDNLVGGNNDSFGELIGADDITVSDSEEGIFRLGNVKPIKVSGLIDDVCKRLSISKHFVHLIGDPDATVSKIAWCTGAGFGFVYPAYKCGAECFITGDVKYHDARDASERGMNVIDIGHFGSEKIFTHNMAEKLRKVLDVTVFESNMDVDPFCTSFSCTG